MISALLLVLSSVQASERPPDTRQALHVVPSGGAYAVVDGSEVELTPGLFAERVDDWITWQRYYYESKRLKVMSDGMYYLGGTMAILGANVLPNYAPNFTDPDTRALMQLSAGTLVVGGLAMIGGGFLTLYLGRRELDRPDHWWTYEQAKALAEQHNANLGLSQAPELDPQPSWSWQASLGPGSLVVSARF